MTLATRAAFLHTPARGRLAADGRRTGLHASGMREMAAEVGVCLGPEASESSGWRLRASAEMQLH